MEGALGSGGMEVLEKEEASLSDSCVLISLGSPAELVDESEQTLGDSEEKPGVLQFMGWQRAGHDLLTEQQQYSIMHIHSIFSPIPWPMAFRLLPSPGFRTMNTENVCIFSD